MNDTTTYLTTTYLVEGMTCGGCVRSVTNAVQAALPDASVDVALEAGTLTISGAHDEAAVRQAVEDAGFDFAGAAPT